MFLLNGNKIDRRDWVHSNLPRLSVLFWLRQRLFDRWLAVRGRKFWEKNRLMPIEEFHARISREVLEEGVTGWIAGGATPNSFALAMERCWEAQGAWAQMGEQAYAKALEVAVAEPSKRLLEVLESAVKQSKQN